MYFYCLWEHQDENSDVVLIQDRKLSKEEFCNHVQMAVDIVGDDDINKIAETMIQLFRYKYMICEYSYNTWVGEVYGGDE